MTANQEDTPSNQAAAESLEDDSALTRRTWVSIVTVVVILLGIALANHTMWRSPVGAPAPADPIQTSELKAYTTDVYVGYTEPRNLHNGIAFPFGEPLEQFRKDHSAECFAFEGEMGCEVRIPSRSECPSVDACSHVTYLFKDDRLSGFMADYSHEAWENMLAASARTFGSASKEATNHLGPMTTRSVTWEFTDGTALSFVNYTGTDVQGNAIGQPFSVHYGMASELNR